MKSVLIPLLSLRQLDKKFLLEATKDAHLVVFLEVIDPRSGLTPTELTERMDAVQESLKEAEYELRKRGVRVSFIEEWGNWEDKIKNVFKREGLDEVVVPRNLQTVSLTIEGVKITRI